MVRRFSVLGSTGACAGWQNFSQTWPGLMLLDRVQAERSSRSVCKPRSPSCEGSARRMSRPSQQRAPRRGVPSSWPPATSPVRPTAKNSARPLACMCLGVPSHNATTALVSSNCTLVWQLVGAPYDACWEACAYTAYFDTSACHTRYVVSSLRMHLHLSPMVSQPCCATNDWMAHRKAVHYKVTARAPPMPLCIHTNLG